MRLSAFVIACAFAAGAADVEVGNGDADNTYTGLDAYAAATRIVKTGTGKTTLDFGDSFPSGFTGEIEVREGTLAVASDLRSYGNPVRITVASGATVDLTSSNQKAGGLKNAEFVIAGTGAGGGGAIRRTDGNALTDAIGGITLTSDALVYLREQVGIYGTAAKNASVNLNGHTLSVDASGTVFYCPGVQFCDEDSTGETGDIVMLAGTFFPRYNTMEYGTTNNTITLKSGAALRFRDLTVKPKWKVITEGAASFTADQRSTAGGTLNAWAGPVEAGGALTLNAAKNTTAFFSVDGDITGGKDLEIGSSTVGTVSLKGTNDIGEIVIDAPSGGELAVAGGETALSERLILTGGGLSVENAKLRFRWNDGFLSSGYGSTVAGETMPVISIGENGVMCAEESENAETIMFYLGKSEGKCGVIEVQEGAVLSNISVSVGNSGLGAVRQTGGTVYLRAPAVTQDRPNTAKASGSYAYFGIGGDFTYDDAGSDKGGMFGASGNVVFSVREGGRFNLVNTGETVSFVARDGGHLAYFQDGGSKGTVTGWFNMGDADSSHRAYAGSIALTVEGAGTELESTQGIRILWNKAGASAVVNVNEGGAISSPSLYKAYESAEFYLNLNGGILKPSGGNFSYSADEHRRPTRATVYEGGFVIDTSESLAADGTPKDTRIDFPFLAPGEGKRVVSVALPEDEDFTAESERLIGPPVVTITGAGTGATAFALYDDSAKTLTGIRVTSPGWGYTEGTTAVISGGGLANEYECAVTLGDPPESGWKGLVKRGASRLDLYGANTFRGDVKVEEGLLKFVNEADQSGMPIGAGLTVCEGATVSFASGATPVTVPFLAGSGSVTYGNFTVTERIECTADEVFTGKHFKLNRKLTLADGVQVVVTDPENLVKYRNSAPAVVIAAGVAKQETDTERKLTLAGAVSFAFSDGDAAASPETWRLSRKGDTLVLRPVKGTSIVLR